MEKRTFTLDSSDGKSKLSGFLFLPEGHPRAVVQICHGMCEYILRYEELAQHLTDAGYAVCGIDHLGHGSTARLNNLAKKVPGTTWWRIRRSSGRP